MATLRAAPRRAEMNRGFRRTVVENIVVGSSSEVQRDLVMRIGVVTNPDLLIMPSGGFAGALRAATVIAHVRVTRVVGVLADLCRRVDRRWYEDRRREPTVPRWR